MTLDERFVVHRVACYNLNILALFHRRLIAGGLVNLSLSLALSIFRSLSLSGAVSLSLAFSLSLALSLSPCLPLPLSLSLSLSRSPSFYTRIGAPGPEVAPEVQGLESRISGSGFRV